MWREGPALAHSESTVSPPPGLRLRPFVDWTMSPSSLHETCVKTIRFLAADAIERGACGLKDPNRAPDVILLTIGSKRHFSWTPPVSPKWPWRPG